MLAFAEAILLLSCLAHWIDQDELVVLSLRLMFSLAEGRSWDVLPLIFS